MTDSDDLSPETAPPAAPAPAPEHRPRRIWPWVALLSVVIVPALLLGLWTAITMTYTYSSGERAGYIQKFSEKGWLCKTWEGELAMVNVPGAMQERWAFTVRDDSVAAAINDLQGRRVALHYREHRGVPLSCLGETAYFVDGVRALDDPFGGEGAPGQAPSRGDGSATPTAPPRDTIDPPAGTP
jgi:hypothetical protein